MCGRGCLRRPQAAESARSAGAASAHRPVANSREHLPPCKHCAATTAATNLSHHRCPMAALELSRALARNHGLRFLDILDIVAPAASAERAAGAPPPILVFLFGADHFDSVRHSLLIAHWTALGRRWTGALLGRCHHAGLSRSLSALLSPLATLLR